MKDISEWTVWLGEGVMNHYTVTRCFSRKTVFVLKMCPKILVINMSSAWTINDFSIKDVWFQAIKVEEPEFK